MEKVVDIRKRSEWMKGNLGVSFHWTSMTAYSDGSTGTYKDAVDNFDVKRFVDTLKMSGAGHCIFTLAHAKQYLAFPNKTLESILPGRTTERDLIGEIAAGLNSAGIRFIAYYNHSCNGTEDPEWEDTCGYFAGARGNLDSFADKICNIVKETSERYGSLISGWWFDSPYSVDPRGPHNFICTDIGDWLFPWDKLVDSARSGNADSAVCINAGIGENYQYTTGLDYYAGETVRLDEVFTPEAEPGITDYRWITIDNPEWVYLAKNKGEFSDSRFTDEAIREFVRDNAAHDRMTTFNMEIDRNGKINPKAIRQFMEIQK